MEYKAITDAHPEGIDVEIKAIGGDHYEATVAGKIHQVELHTLHPGRYVVRQHQSVDTDEVCAVDNSSSRQIQVHAQGWCTSVKIIPAAEYAIQQSAARPGPIPKDCGPATGKWFVSPMTGSVQRILVAEGMKVEKDQALLVLQAMKMENELQAPFPAKIEKILVSKDEAVELGRPLLWLVPL